MHDLGTLYIPAGGNQGERPFLFRVTITDSDRGSYENLVITVSNSNSSKKYLQHQLNFNIFKRMILHYGSNKSLFSSQ